MKTSKPNAARIATDAIDQLEAAGCYAEWLRALAFAIKNAQACDEQLPNTCSTNVDALAGLAGHLAHELSEMTEYQSGLLRDALTAAKE